MCGGLYFAKLGRRNLVSRSADIEFPYVRILLCTISLDLRVSAS